MSHAKDSRANAPKILFQFSGSIAAYKACGVVSRLVQAGFEVQTVASRAALEFVGAATLEGLTGRPVQTETFAPGTYMHHIHLMKWADLIVLCPATANTINKLASGIGDDLLSTLFLAHDFQKPFLIAPAMNTKMYRHPTTQESLSKLRSWGVEILETASGVLACGDVGEGKLLEPDLIFSEITSRIPAPKASSASASTPAVVDKSLDILITAGGTREAIDGVRSITNTSTGMTGAILAETLSSRGHRVTFLHSREGVRPQAREGQNGLGAITLEPFTSYRDLDGSLRRLLGEKKFDAVIHAAAVSDYSVDRLIVDGRPIQASEKTKLDSNDGFSIELKRNPKILPNLKEYARNPSLKVVGFKLTVGADVNERQAAVLRASQGTDLIVHNDLQEISAVQHHSTLYTGTKVVGRCETKIQLAMALEDFLSAGREPQKEMQI